MMLPYDGITRTGSKGVSHFGYEDPQRSWKVLESPGKGKQGTDTKLGTGWKCLLYCAFTKTTLRSKGTGDE